MGVVEVGRRSEARANWHAPLAAALEELPIDDSWTNLMVNGYARQRRANLWTVVLLDFSIRANGPTLHEAVDAAGSELAVYIVGEVKRRLPSDPGVPLALHEFMRPLETRSRVKWELGAIVSHVGRWFDRDPLDVFPLNLPIAHATCVAEPEVIEAIGDGDDGGDAEEALMAEGYRELASDLLAFAEQTVAAGAETLPPKQ